MYIRSVYLRTETGFLRKIFDSLRRFYSETRFLISSRVIAEKTYSPLANFVTHLPNLNRIILTYANKNLPVAAEGDRTHPFH